MKINLTVQEIVKFAYMTKDIIENTWGKKLTDAQLNCYLECFYSIQEILEDVDREYLKKHAPLVRFFREGKRLISKNNELQWEKKI
jgi:hypothetical protein